MMKIKQDRDDEDKITINKCFAFQFVKIMRSTEVVEL
jgi:hypothetical protein